MKKLLFTLALAGALIFNAKSQGLYFGLGAGYGFKAGSRILGTNRTSDGTTEAVNGSFGAGFVPTLNVGYLFTQSLGAELNFGYLFGKKTSIQDNYNWGNGTLTGDLHAQSFFINPAFVIRSNGDSKVVPYGKMGIFLGLVNSSTTNYHSTGNPHYDQKIKNKGGAATGITTSFGIDYKLSDNIMLFGELNARLASWTPTKYSNTAVTNSSSTTQNGDYKKSTSAMGIQSLAPLLPMSAIGFNVGVRYCLFK